MKQRTTRIALLIFLVLLSVLLLASCGRKPPEDTTAPTAPPVAFDNLSAYTIVYATDPGDELFAAIRDFREALREKTGIHLRQKEDFVLPSETVPTDTPEILIDDTNRAESDTYRLGAQDTAIYFENNRLVIRGGSPRGTVAALHRFVEVYLSGDGVMRPAEPDIIRKSYPFGGATVGGVSIYDFQIVRERSYIAIAEVLRDEIAEKTGAYLPIVDNWSTPAANEILLGNFTGERATTPVSDASYRIEMLGTRLSLRGGTEDGAYAAMLAFLQQFDSLFAAGNLAAGTVKSGAVSSMALFTLNLPTTFGSMEGAYDLTYSTETVLDRFFATRDELPEEVTVVEKIPLSRYPLSARKTYYVSPNGSDTAKGTREEPFATLKKALDKIGRDGGVIFLMGGRYELSETVKMGTLNSGSRQAPLFIKALDGEEPVISSNKSLSMDENKWSVVNEFENSDVYERIPSAARSHVIYTTLEKQGWQKTDIPQITASGAPFLYVGGKEYVLARFPNIDATPTELAYFTHTYDTGSVSLVQSVLRPEWERRALAAGQSPDAWKIGWEIRMLNRKDNASDKNSCYEYGDEFLSWVNTGNIWYYGSIYSGFEFGYYNLALEAEGQYWAHDEDGNRWTPTSGKTPYLGTPKSGGYYSLKSTSPCGWGCNPSTNSAAGRNTFYLFNAIEALDAPGEWFYDEATGCIYLYPERAHEDYTAVSAELTNPESFVLLELTNVQNVVIDGLTFDGCSSTALSATGTENIVVQNCTFRNTKGANLNIGGYNSAVIYNDFSSASSAAVIFGGGSLNLIPSGNVFQNNVIHDNKCQEGISWGGCRVVISHNYFNNTIAWGYAGVECIIEYNRFEGGSDTETDGGMIYISGGLSRGNHYRNNLFHMFVATHNAVYNDTQGSGNYMYYNIVSALHSLSDHNTGWYSSSGWGNVAYGNLMILRNPAERLAAGSDASIENDGTYVSPYNGDSLLESALFFYNGGDDLVPYSRWAPVDYSGRPQKVVNPSGTLGMQPQLSQSECGFSWYSLKATDVERYLGIYDQRAWYSRAPEFMHALQGTKMLLDFHTLATADPNDAIDYHIKYFYVPWYLTGKSHTFNRDASDLDVPLGTVLTVPEYTYLVAGSSQVPEVKRVAERSFTVEGEFTLTYEEIAAMERIRRGSAYSVVMNNIILGGTSVYETVGGKYVETGVSNRDLVIDDYAAGMQGYFSTTSKDYNFMAYGYSNILPNAKFFDYTLSDSAWAVIAAEATAKHTLEPTAIPEIREELEKATQNTGPTFFIDYADWLTKVYPDFYS